MGFWKKQKCEKKGELTSNWTSTTLHIISGLRSNVGGASETEVGVGAGAEDSKWPCGKYTIKSPFFGNEGGGPPKACLSNKL